MLKRVLNSKKTVLTLVGLAAAAVSEVTGLGPEVGEHATEVVVAAFGLLTTIQAALDFKWGSASDETGSFGPVDKE